MIIPPHLAIKSLRDSGYKNAASAIAELIDNSIQHDASNVELICFEKSDMVRQRYRSRLNKIAVIDNGSGMNEDVLYKALQFGNGTNLTFESQTNLGKFGMGLPSSSISQAKKVEVWTWQNGLKSAIYSYLDVDEIIDEKLVDVPRAEKKDIPDFFLSTSKTLKGSKSGTIVLWTELDRCNWKTAKSIFKHSENLIGRVYRYFLINKSVKINFLAFNEKDLKKIDDKFVKPNDPLYLIDATSCPDPFSDKAMFVEYGNDTIPITFLGDSYEVEIKYSIASKEAREIGGGGKIGKHARDNIGISILRANRELFLDTSLVIGYDPRERWWGCEVKFQPQLDEVFGVTNNKQFAANFSEVAATLSNRENNISKQEVLDDYEEDDPKRLLVDVILKLKSRIGTLRSAIAKQKEGSRKAQRHSDTVVETAEDKASKKANERENSGNVSQSDRNPSIEDVGVEQVKSSLVEEGYEEYEIEDLLSSEKFILSNADLDTDAFFSVNIKYDKVLVQLNNSHPAYKNLIEILDDNELSESIPLEQRLNKAAMGLKLLLLSWARYEDEQVDKFRDRVKQIRREWGKVAKDFLDIED